MFALRKQVARCALPFSVIPSVAKTAAMPSASVSHTHTGGHSHALQEVGQELLITDLYI